METVRIICHYHPLRMSIKDIAIKLEISRKATSFFMNHINDAISSFKISAMADHLLKVTPILVSHEDAVRIQQIENKFDSRKKFHVVRGR